MSIQYHVNLYLLFVYELICIVCRFVGRRIRHRERRERDRERERGGGGRTRELFGHVYHKPSENHVNIAVK